MDCLGLLPAIADDIFVSMTLPSPALAHLGMRRWLDMTFLALAAAAIVTTALIWQRPLTAQRASGDQAKQKAASQDDPESRLAQRITTDETEVKLLESRIQVAKQLVDNEKERLASLDNSSRLLMSIATVFAILLGFAARKTLEDQRKAAGEGLKLQLQLFDQQFAKP
jgi:hypothetical protein